jgi:hypothetical protein
MAEVERKFINGLIRWYNPRSILEIGVGEGSGSVNIINAIGDMPDSFLTSVDFADVCLFRDRPVGFDVSECFPNLQGNKYNLIVGKDISQVIEDLDTRFDMCVIDSGHVHPVEVLNFLCVLPFLKDGAVVILHDPSMYLLNDYQWGMSPPLLLCSAVAEKLMPHSAYGFIHKYEHKNIVAMQITSDTRKYAGNIFETLLLPWEMFPEGYISDVKNLLKKHYSAEAMQCFERGSEVNRTWTESDRYTSSSEVFRKALSSLSKLRGEQVVFYGAGKNMTRFLKGPLSVCVWGGNFQIWDINHENIQEICGKKVIGPDFRTRPAEGAIAVVTISDRRVSDSVKAELQGIGYTVFVGLSSLVRYLCEKD